MLIHIIHIYSNSLEKKHTIKGFKTLTYLLPSQYATKLDGNQTKLHLPYTEVR